MDIEQHAMEMMKVGSDMASTLVENSIQDRLYSHNPILGLLQKRAMPEGGDMAGEGVKPDMAPPAKPTGEAPAAGSDSKDLVVALAELIKDHLKKDPAMAKAVMAKMQAE